MTPGRTKLAQLLKHKTRGELWDIERPLWRRRLHLKLTEQHCLDAGLH